MTHLCPALKMKVKEKILKITDKLFNKNKISFIYRYTTNRMLFIRRIFIDFHKMFLHYISIIFRMLFEEFCV